ncbi:hypothetical protein Tco_1394724 [Tanacetum coccineum]
MRRREWRGWRNIGYGSLKTKETYQAEARTKRYGMWEYGDIHSDDEENPLPSAKKNALKNLKLRKIGETNAVVARLEVPRFLNIPFGFHGFMAPTDSKM